LICGYAEGCLFGIPRRREDSVITNITEIFFEDRKWIDLYGDIIQWEALVSVVLDF
jgi:hypothetical protein